VCLHLLFPFQPEKSPFCCNRGRSRSHPPFCKPTLLFFFPLLWTLLGVSPLPFPAGDLGRIFSPDGPLLNASLARLLLCKGDLISAVVDKLVFRVMKVFDFFFFRSPVPWLLNFSYGNYSDLDLRGRIPSRAWPSFVLELDCRVPVPFLFSWRNYSAGSFFFIAALDELMLLLSLFPFLLFSIDPSSINFLPFISAT